MSKPSKKIKDCSECQQEINFQLGNCKSWETKRKEIINKIKEEFCLEGTINPYEFQQIGHRGRVEKLLADYYESEAGENMGEAWKCDKCDISGLWEKNGYGDFKVEGSTCQHKKPHSFEYLKSKGVSIPHKGNKPTERERESKILLKSIKLSNIFSPTILNPSL